MSPSTPGGFLNRFSRTSKDDRRSNLNFESDGELAVNRLAVELAAHTEKLEEISRFWRDRKSTEEVDPVSSSSRSQRRSSSMPLGYSLSEIVNRLRIAQSTN